MFVMPRVRTLFAVLTLLEPASSLGQVDFTPRLSMSTVIPAGQPRAVAVGRTGDIVVAGSASAGWPTTRNAFWIQPTATFVAKLARDGTILYSSFFPATDITALAVDADGYIYLAGRAGDGFPIVNAVQSTHAGDGDAYLAKLDPSGTKLVFSTFIGGKRSEYAYGVSVSGLGVATVSGLTESPDFPVTTPSTGNGFIAQIDTTLPRLLFSVRTLAPSGDAGGHALGLDETVYYVSREVPRNPELRVTCRDRLSGDAFSVVSFDPRSLTSRVIISIDCSAYVRSIQVVDSASIVLSGFTRSREFPVTDLAYRPDNPQGGQSPFVLKLRTDSQPAILASSYFGSVAASQTGDDVGSIEVLGDGFAIAGLTRGAFPTTPGAFQQNGGGHIDAYIALFDGALTKLSYGSYLGGTSTDFAAFVRADRAGGLYIVGVTASADFPVTRLQPFPAPNGGLFITRLHLPTGRRRAAR